MLKYKKLQDTYEEGNINKTIYKFIYYMLYHNNIYILLKNVNLYRSKFLTYYTLYIFHNLT